MRILWSWRIIFDFAYGDIDDEFPQLVRIAGAAFS